MTEYINKAPTATIFDSLVKAKSVLASHHNILVSVSGGADSDCMIDIVHNLAPKDEEHKITYVWFDTGIEMDATKRHLNYLESRYNIRIIKRRADVTVPAAITKAGYPFFSKVNSDRISRLQHHDFDWDKGTIEELQNEFHNCKGALSWWCGTKGRFVVSKVMREYIHENPPDFPISDKCCYYAKKKPSADMEKELKADLVCLGIRRAEGGVRASISQCFNSKQDTNKADRYYPCFWWIDEDRAAFEQTYNIVHSDAYTIYGFKRTGCAGCPFNSRFEEELKILHKYEPKLANAVEHIFAPSYEYTRAYRKFKESRKKKHD